MIHRFIAISIKIVAEYLKDIDKLLLNYVLEGKGVRIVRTIMKMKNKIRRIMLLIFRLSIKL